MLENIGCAFQGIWTHKMRSFLTMLGIIIGIASIIAIVSTIKGTNEQIKQELIGSGNNTVKVTLCEGDNEYDPSNSDENRITPVLTDGIKKKVRALDLVERATFFYSRTYENQIFYKNVQFSGGNILGVDMEYLATCGYVIVTGRSFLERDYKRFGKVAMLDTDAAESLFGSENPIGKTIEIYSEPFIVVGVYKNPDEYQPEINSLEEYNMYYQDRTGTILIPSTSWPIVYRFDEPENAIIRAKNTDAMSKAGRQTADTLNELISEKDGNLKYSAVDLLEQVRKQQELSEQTNIQLVWIASIALLVGGIGVMNIMLVSVTERTGEIGLRKAIGARKSAILFQFLTEAAVLTSLGGGIGVAVGIIMAQIISRVSGAPVAIDVTASAGAVLFSVIIGLIFGLLPSIKAANLNPIDALRRE